MRNNQQWIMTSMKMETIRRWQPLINDRQMICHNPYQKESHGKESI
jgi:hypothetical protein